MCILSHFIHAQLFATLCTIAHQVPLSMGFSKQEYWSRLPCLLQGIFPTQGLNSGLLQCRQILYNLSHQGNPDGTVGKYYWFYHKTLSHSYTFLSVHTAVADVAAKLLQSCLTLCDRIDGSPPGSSIPGILQARILEWVAISFSDLIAKSRLTLWNPLDHSPPGPSVHGISQARILDWVAISFSLFILLLFYFFIFLL